MKDLGDLTRILGIEVVRDRPRGTIRIHQGGYIREVLGRYGFAECREVDTPVEGKVKSGAVEEVGEEVKVDQTEYRDIVGSLMYASTSTRPDISYAVHQAARHSESPKQKHLVACKRILRYLSTTPEMGITSAQKAFQS